MVTLIIHSTEYFIIYLFPYYFIFYLLIWFLHLDTCKNTLVFFTKMHLSVIVEEAKLAGNNEDSLIICLGNCRLLYNSSLSAADNNCYYINYAARWNVCFYVGGSR